MNRLSVDEIELEYEVHGNGEPIVFIHAGVFADWFKPLVQKEILTSQFRIIRYHRLGYAGSSHLPGNVSLAQQAAHLRSLMKQLGIKRGHLVGHSSSANIAMQSALDAPDTVQSLILLEPALKVTKAASDRAAAMAVVVENYRMGDKATAIDAFMRAVAGDYRADLERVLPGAFEQAVNDADTFLGQEWPAVQQWNFTPEDAKKITQPTLAVIGEKNLNVSVWKERQTMLLEWLPNVEQFVLPGATHLLHLQNPDGMAEAIANFCKHHPISHPLTLL